MPKGLKKKKIKEQNYNQKEENLKYLRDLKFDELAKRLGDNYVDRNNRVKY